MSPAAPLGCDLGHVRHIPLRYDSHDSQASALKLILTLMPDWASDDSHVDFIRFTDGITNTLLKAVNRRPGLSKADIDREAVLLRAYGSGTDILIDREREAANHELLMKHDLAPDLLARFDNGMLYRFIPGHVATPQDLSQPEVLVAIARRLGEWHARLPCLHSPSPSNGVSNGNGTSNGHSSTNRDHTDAETLARIANTAPGKPAPNVWTTMQKWILALPTDTEEKRQRVALLQREMDEMVKQLAHRPGLGHNGLVFAHCDLLCANVIIHRTEGQPTTVSFIDYEYATPSPAAFDVANHFAEWVGYDCDYTAVPKVSQRRTFISEYIKSYVALAPSPPSGELDIEQETQRLMDEVDIYRGVPGFYWGIWASIQAMISDIDFDYASYSELRLGEYWAFKAERDGTRAAEGREMPLREKVWSTEA